MQQAAAAAAGPEAPGAQARPPGSAWRPVDGDALHAELLRSAWTLVEFWAPNNLYTRLMAPIRTQVPHSHGDRLRLLCCVAVGEAQRQACARVGITGLPDLALFRGARRVRRWHGAVNVPLLRHDLDALLGRTWP